jgi:alpha-D-ribose 1-methylphosphonate 5-triphosphate synthase subunit PhnH
MIEAGIQSWLAFHTGALVTDDRSEAAFAFIEAGGQMPPLSTFATGTQDYPDRSTTLVLELTGLTGGEFLDVSGPGVDGTTAIAPSGLPAHFDGMWRENTALFPRGVDLILVAGSKILCLPRTSKVTRKGA